MIEYTHRVQYYETDKMGFAHHSNYIRWFEEARLYFMDKIGMPYKTLENMGFFCPVLSVQCDYKKSTYFDDIVKIRVQLSEFGNVRHKFTYTIVDSDTEEIKASGETEHCVLNKEGHVISLKRKEPELFDKMISVLEPKQI